MSLSVSIKSNGSFSEELKKGREEMRAKYKEKMKERRENKMGDKLDDKPSE